MFETPEFPRGSQLTAAKLQDASDLLDLMLRSRGSNASIGSCGFLTATSLPETFWVRVTGDDGGTPPAHSWVQVQENGATQYIDMGDGMQGDKTSQPLYDINGQRIPTNKYVRVWRGMGDYYLTLDGSVFAETLAYITITSQTSQVITLKDGGTCTVYPAEIWTLNAGVWTAGHACWYLPTNQETPPLDIRFLANEVAQDNATTPAAVYSTQLIVSAAKITSVTTSSVTLSGGGTLNLYPADIQILVGGIWTTTRSAWFLGLNGETPTLNARLSVQQVAVAVDGNPVVATHVAGLTAILQITSTTTQSITLAGGGTLTVYPANIQILNEATSTWTNAGSAWFAGLQGETPTLHARLFCRNIANDNSGVGVWATEIAGLTAILKITSTTPSTVTMNGGGTLSVYPAQVQILNEATSTWSNAGSAWFVGLNGETPTLNARLFCRNIANDNTGVGIWATEIAGLTAVIQVTSLTSSSISLDSGGTATVYPAQYQALSGGTWTNAGSVYFLPLNGETPELNKRYFCRNVANQASTGTSVWSTELYRPDVNITINNNFTWNLNNFYWTINGGGGIIFDVPFMICGYQFWCCTTWSLSLSTYNNATLPAVGSPDQGATVYDVSTSNTGGTTITGIVPVSFNGATGPQIIVLNNVGINPIILSNNNAGSLAANRFFLPPTYSAGGSVTLEQDDSITLWWDYCTDHCWKVLACTVDIDSSSSGTTGTNGETVLPSAYNVTSSFADTGLSVTLPSSGTYLVQAEVTGTITNNGSPAGGYVQSRLWNVTAGAAVADTLRVVCECQVVGLTGTGTSACGRIITVTGSTTIRLEAQYISTGSVLASPTIAKGTTSFGTTLMRYIKLA